MSVKIKVCGLIDEENIASLLELSPDFLGFILVEDSKRYITQNRLVCLLKNQKIAESAILVLRDMPLGKVFELPLHSVKGIQLHGSETGAETPEYISEIKNRFPDLIIFKAIGISSEKSFELCNAYKACIDYFLFDTKVLKPEGECSGGTGESFNWEFLTHYTLDKPYLLSGGLGQENISAVRDLYIKDSRLVGVDLNSKYELEPGIKNIDILRESFKLLRG